ncbi:MAG: PCC domain-containing protein [Sulfobacillus sp.]
MAHRFSPRANQAAQIGWREWGAEAFAEAKADARPVLLSLSAVWCHWCHVMDETTYSDPTVIDLIRRELMPIRVDADQRPDIDRRYNMGGWPTTAFLNADGELLTGATYLPPAQMVETVHRVVAYFRQHGSQTVPREPEPISPAKPEAKDLEALYQQISQAYDQRHGGFGHAPKFPLTDVLSLLQDLDLGPLAGPSRQMVESSLTAMVSGGLYDPIEGGFFRYSTERDWSHPHYEKMLDDQAALLEVLLRLGDRAPPLLRSAAIGTADYVVRTLYDGACLAGSQDADEAYYQLDANQRRTIAAPLVDRTLYAGWNARAARALVAAGIVYQRPDWSQAGSRAFRTLLERCMADGVLRHTDHRDAVENLTEDIAQVGLTALFLNALAPAVEYEQAAQVAAELLLRALDAQGFRDRMDAGEGRILQASYPLRVNALAGQLTAALDDLHGDPEMARAWQGALTAACRAASNQGMLGAAYGRMLVASRVRPLVVSLPLGLPDRLRAVVVAHLPAGATLRPDPLAPGVVVCRGQQCSRPISEVSALRLALGAPGPERDGQPPDVKEGISMEMGRIPQGADLITFFQQWAVANDVQTAWVSAIGSLTQAQLAFFDQQKRLYQPMVFAEPLEILSLSGNLSTFEGQPFAHLHLVAGRPDGSVIGGHVLAGCQVYTGEYRISVHHGPPLTRTWDERLGLRLWPEGMEQP